LFASIAIANRIREDVPFLLYSLLACLVASTSYHTCYSFEICYFDDIFYHRHMDYFCSLMLIEVLFTVALWRRRQPHPLPPLGHNPIRKWKCARRPRALLNPILRYVAKVNVDDPRLARTPLEYYRPWIVDPLTFALHLINAYVHIHQGKSHIGSLVSFGIAVVLLGAAHLVEIIRYKLKLRLGVFVVVMTPFAVSYLVFFTSEQYGAIGHSLWHLLGFSGVYLYLRLFPFFTEHDGSYIYLGFE